METATLNELKEQQRKSWNRFSSGWKKWDDFVMGWLRPVGNRIIEAAELQADYRVLDCATGTGEPGLSAAKIAHRGKVTGTDLSEQMIDIALRMAQKHNVKNYEAIVSDTDLLPFDDDYFDAVISRFGIIFFPDLHKSVGELVRVLKPGKKIAVSVWADPSYNPWASLPMGVIRSVLTLPPPPPGQPGIFRCAEEGYTEKVFREAGLTEIKSTTVDGIIKYESADFYWNYTQDIAAPIITTLETAEEHQREIIVRQLMEELKKYENKDTGEIALPWKAYVTEARKLS